ncbi:MAG TPA: TRAM domain-containing protein, partial [Pelobium sp.]|nr:TRAM domain-containing protein [Pelobium sp.]
AMEGTVPGSQRADRSKMLHILSEKKRRVFYQSQIGKEEEVLFEGDHKEGFMHGFTKNYVKVKVKYDPVLVNELKAVKLEAILPDGDVSVIEAVELLKH